MAKSLPLVSLMVVAFVLSVGALPADARAFGDGPLDAVIKQAGNATRCSGLTQNQLAAMMLAPTWEEAFADPNKAPSPMAMSRFDRSTLLYSFGTVADQPRAFWHPGIGMWQLDDVGEGSFMTVNQRINASTSANKAADTMASRYCNVSGTAAQRRSFAWGPWFACNDGSCEPTFDVIYCSGNDTVCNITRKFAVSNSGGMATRTCRFGGDISTNFTCWYVDIPNAEGDTSNWQQNPKTGDSSISPLAFPFYAWLATKENRDWIVDDTRYSRGEIKARRDLGSDSRDTGVLSWVDADNPLCDVTARRGNCSGPFP